VSRVHRRLVQTVDRRIDQIQSCGSSSDVILEIVAFDPVFFFINYSSYPATMDVEYDEERLSLLYLSSSRFFAEH
jgi:hypothetical protein